MPKKFLAILLFLILALSTLQFSQLLVTKNLVLAVGTAVVVDLLLLRIRKIPFFFPSAAIVSGLIIALLTSPTAPFYVIIASGILAIFGKQFIVRINNRHIFNPAAFGLFTAALLFNQPISWWGVSWGTIPLILTVVSVGYLVLFRMRRFRITLSFLVAYLILKILASGSVNVSPLFDGTVMFFALVMLPEPMTSPAESKKQVLYGVFVAILTFVIGNFAGSLTIDPLLSSLLLANIIFRFL